jgi:hypothetical protein
VQRIEAHRRDCRPPPTHTIRRQAVGFVEFGVFSSARNTSSASGSLCGCTLRDSCRMSSTMRFTRATLSPTIFSSR